MSEVPIPSDEEARFGSRDWPHAPPHRLAESGVYFVTARCVDRQHLLHSPERRDWFLRALFTLGEKYGWRFEAWAVLSNHYHFVAQSPADGASSLGKFIRHLHGMATQEMNRLDRLPGRTRLWHNYRETHLDLLRGYYARLNYVHNNAAHHGLRPRGADWRWSSAAAFEKLVTPAWVQTVYSFGYDRIAAVDGE